MTSPTADPGNRRRHPRYQRRLGVQYQRGDGSPSFACTVNVGPGGLLLWTNRTLAEGDVIEGKLRLPGGEVVSFVGQVRWVGPVASRESMLQAGIQFSVMPEAAFYSMLYAQAKPGVPSGN